MAASFNIGDRVIAVSGIRSGLTGTIVDLSSTTRAGVSFDDLRAGHDCHGACENGHGWYVDTSALELILEVSELQTEDDLSLDYLLGMGEAENGERSQVSDRT